MEVPAAAPVAPAVSAEDRAVPVDSVEAPADRVGSAGIVPRPVRPCTIGLHPVRPCIITVHTAVTGAAAAAAVV